VKKIHAPPKGLKHRVALRWVATIAQYYNGCDVCCANLALSLDPSNTIWLEAISLANQCQISIRAEIFSESVTNAYQMKVHCLSGGIRITSLNCLEDAIMFDLC